MTPRAQAAFDKIKGFLLSDEINIFEAFEQVSAIASDCTPSERAEVMEAYTEFRDKEFPKEPTQ